MVVTSVARRRQPQTPGERRRRAPARRSDMMLTTDTQLDPGPQPGPTSRASCGGTRREVEGRHGVGRGRSTGPCATTTGILDSSSATADGVQRGSRPLSNSDTTKSAATSADSPSSVTSRRWAICPTSAATEHATIRGGASTMRPRRWASSTISLDVADEGLEDPEEVLLEAVPERVGVPEQQLHERPVGLEELEGGPHRGPERRVGRPARRRGEHRLGDVVAQRLALGLHERVEERVLGVEVPVDRPVGELRRLGDVGDGRGVVALAGEHLLGRGQDVGPAPLFLLVAHGAPHRTRRARRAGSGRDACGGYRGSARHARRLPN